MLKETTSGGGETVNNYYPNQGYAPWGGCGRGLNLGDLLGGGTVNLLGGGGGKTLGVIGTVLGAIAVGVPLLRGVGFGGWGGAPYAAGGCCEGGYVTQKELSLTRELIDAKSENAALAARSYTDRAKNAVDNRICEVASAQALVNANTTGAIATLQAQAAQTASMQMSIIKPCVLAPSQSVLTAYQTALAGRSADETTDPATGA